MKDLGVVAIGRNEGDRLIHCLDCLKQQLPESVPIIYVDSGSTDNSVMEAQRRGVHVVDLDMSIPFTAARARNAGLTYLTQHFPDTAFVQFIDGDCEMLSGWLPAGLDFLKRRPDVAIVFGHLHERFPEASVYNRLAAMEWNYAPLGDAEACGGIALMRVTPIRAIGGFNETMICGEEPEMCIRLGQMGWKIWRIEADMAIHDIDMHRFGQWWKRATRTGWAIAEGVDRYGHLPQDYMSPSECYSGWVWGAILPVSAIAFAGISHGLTLTLLVGYLLLLVKIYRARQRSGDRTKDAFLYAFFCVISKVPQAIGQAKYWLHRWQRKPAQLIEYKSARQ